MFRVRKPGGVLADHSHARGVRPRGRPRPYTLAPLSKGRFLELWQAIILGIVEGITEYLPVSSTGHLIIASALMGLDDPERKASIDAFTIVVQGGAILAVLGLYWPRVMQMIRGVLGRDVEGRRLLINLVLAFVPAAVLGLLLAKWIEMHLFHAGPVVAALFLGGIYMMIVDRIARPRPVEASGAMGAVAGRRWRLRAEGEISDVTPRRALVIGLFQCVAMWPGMSRSMMTITGGMLTGLRPAAAAEFSFLLGLPTLSAATLYKLAKNLRDSSANGTPNLFQDLGIMSTAAGLVVATLAAAVAVKWLVSFLNRHGLTPFGVYRIGVAVVMLIMIQAGIVAIGGGVVEEHAEPAGMPVGVMQESEERGVQVGAR
jgi:undecaprenyl-diphosphatase